MPAPAAWSSTAVDLTLESPLSCWRIPGGKRSRIVIAPHSPDYDFASLTEQFGQEVSLPAKGHIVEPFSFLLGWTVERIQLPHQSRIAARVEGKSSFARLGLGVHVTAPTIHSGFGWTGDPNYLGIRHSSGDLEHRALSDQVGERDADLSTDLRMGRWHA